MQIGKFALGMNVLHFGVTGDELSFCLVHEVHV